MKGQKTFRPLLPFGETVMFKVPRTKRRIGEFEDRFEKGVWRGMTVQSGRTSWRRWVACTESAE